MIDPINPDPCRDRMNGFACPPRTPRAATVMAACALVGGMVATVLSGCGEDPPPPPPVVKAPPPAPPPAPSVTPIAELMVRYGIDERVRLPEEQAPDNDPARIAVLQFFDATVRGNAADAGAMMSMPDRLQLEAMQADGSWERATEPITRVDLRTGRSPMNDAAVLAVYYVGHGFEPQLWTYAIENDAAMFDAEPTPPDIMNRLSGQDWIAAWYGVLADELAKADEPDELVVVPKQNFDKGEDAEAADLAPGSTPFQPANSPRRPVKDPIDPPDLLPGH